MKIQVRSLAIAIAIAVPIAVTATANSSAAPINGTSIQAAVPAVTTDARYRVRRGYPYPSYWRYPTYNSYRGYPAYKSYRGYQTLAACGSHKPPLANMYLRDFSVPQSCARHSWGMFDGFGRSCRPVDVRFN
jgi:hypothetical protein